jgi:hypothetical protein
MRDFLGNVGVMPDERNAPSAIREGARIRAFVMKLAVSIALAAALLIAGEYLAYVFMAHRSGGFNYEYRSYVLWRVAPTKGSNISVDAEGWRRTFYSHCELGAYTIWMFGSSGLWGDFNRDNETIASLLAKKYEESGRQVCVKNYGQRGWASTQEVIQLMLELKHTANKPNVVLFYDGSLDSGLPLESDQVDVHEGFPRFKAKFESWREGQGGFGYLRDTNTYLALQWVGGRLGVNSHAGMEGSFSDQRLNAMGKRVLDNYLANMALMDVLAKQYGFQYFCFWEPWLLSAPKPLTAEEELLKEGFAKSDPGTAEVTNRTYELFRNLNHPHFVYFGDIFKDHPERLFIDTSHLGTEGNRLVAERIFRTLHEHGS